MIVDNVTTIVRAADVELLLKLFEPKTLTDKQWRAYCRMLGSVAASREQDELDKGSKKFQLTGAPDKILFIKFLRELFGLGLKEAKELAEHVMAGSPLEVPAEKLDKFVLISKQSMGGYANFNHLNFEEIP